MLEAIASEALHSQFFNIGLVDDLTWFNSIFAFERFSAGETKQEDLTEIITSDNTQLERLFIYRKEKTAHPEVFEGLRDVRNLQDYLSLDSEEREELTQLAEMNLDYWKGEAGSRLDARTNGKAVKSRKKEQFTNITIKNHIHTLLQNYKTHIIDKDNTTTTLTHYCYSHNTTTGQKTEKGNQQNIYQHWMHNKKTKKYPAFETWLLTHTTDEKIHQHHKQHHTLEGQIHQLLESYKKHIIDKDNTKTTLTTYTRNHNTITGQTTEKGNQKNIYDHWQTNKQTKKYPNNFETWLLTHTTDEQIHQHHKQHHTLEGQIHQLLESYKTHIIDKDNTNTTLTTYTKNHNTITGQKTEKENQGNQKNIYKHWQENREKNNYPNNFEEWLCSHLENKQEAQQILEYSRKNKYRPSKRK